MKRTRMQMTPWFSRNLLWVGVMISLSLCGSGARASDGGIFGRLFGWADREDVQKTADLLTTDGVSDGLNEVARIMDGSTGDAKTLESVKDAKDLLVRQTGELRKNYADLLQRQNEFKAKNYADYAKARQANPNLKVYDYFKKADASGNIGVRARSLETQVRDLGGKIAESERSSAGLDLKAQGAAKAPGFFTRVKGLFKAGGQVLSAMDLAGATGRVAGEFAGALEGTSTFRSAFGRIAEEGGRIKAVAIGSAGGAAAGTLAGPGAFVASPVLAMVGGAGASAVYKETVAKSLEENRQYEADKAAVARYGADMEKLAATRAQVREQKAADQLARRMALQARSAEYDASLKHLDDLRARVAEYNKKMAADDAARRAHDEKQEADKRKSAGAEGAPPAQKAAHVTPSKPSLPAQQVEAAKPAPAPRSAAATQAPAQKGGEAKRSSAPAKKRSSVGTLQRTFSSERNSLSITVNGVALVSEEPGKKHYRTDLKGNSYYDVEGNFIYLAVPGGACTVNVSYQIAGDDAYFIHARVDYVELSEDYIALKNAFKIASSPNHKGPGVFSGQFSFPVDARNHIQKYMIATETTGYGEVYFSVHFVSEENRYMLEE